MDLRQLRFFCMLAETSSFRRAAERLNTSQPPITVAIRRLEQELGVALFERGPRGVRLTTAGAAALPAARDALILVEQVRAAVRDDTAGERGVLRLGFVGSSIYSVLPRLLPAYRERYPRVEFALAEITTHVAVPQLLAGTLDAAIIRAPLLTAADLEVTAIERDDMVVAVPSASSIGAREPIALATLANEPFVALLTTSVLRSAMQSACHQSGFSPRVVHEVPQLSSLLCLVQSGLGLALVPGTVRLNTPPGVRLVSLREPPATELALATPTRASPMARNLRTLALSLDRSVSGH